MPFIDITISSLDSCPESYEPLFSKVWNGTHDGCFQRDGSNCSAAERTTTKAGSGIPAMNMTKISPTGQIACGKRGGSNFLEQVKVEPFTKKCPDGLVPCAEITEATDKICVDATDMANCPIIDIAIMDNSA